MSVLKYNGANTIVFLPDPELEFDEKKFNRRDDIRLALRDHPAVHEFLSHCDAIFQYEEMHTRKDDPRQFTVDIDEYNRLKMRKVELMMRMFALTPGRNDICYCGSGVKYKKCCGK